MACAICVVPYVGTWIEILNCLGKISDWTVVPYVGTWIEILRSCTSFGILNVVPYVGTWIEILKYWRTTNFE